jgi:hypothetical protein
MHDQRSLDVTQSRIGLSLLICLLLAVGYMIVERLVGSGQAPPVEIRAGFHTEPPTAAGHSPVEDQQPQVLAIEGSESPALHTSQRAAPSPDRASESDLR